MTLLLTLAVLRVCQVQAAPHAADVGPVPRAAHPGQGQGDGHARRVRHPLRQGQGKVASARPTRTHSLVTLLHVVM